MQTWMQLTNLLHTQTCPFSTSKHFLFFFSFLYSVSHSRHVPHSDYIFIETNITESISKKKKEKKTLVKLKPIKPGRKNGTICPPKQSPLNEFSGIWKNSCSGIPKIISTEVTKCTAKMGCFLKNGVINPGTSADETIHVKIMHATVSPSHSTNLLAADTEKLLCLPWPVRQLPKQSFWGMDLHLFRCPYFSEKEKEADCCSSCAHIMHLWKYQRCYC